LRGNQITEVPLQEAVATYKYLDPEIYRMAEVFFG
jgi:hypothetical protein